MDQSELLFKEETHEYFVKNIRVPSVSEILRVGGFTEEMPWKAAKVKAVLGTYVHHAARLYLDNNLDEATVVDDVAEYFAGVKQFLDKECADKSCVIVKERPLYSTRWGFAGTCDLVILKKKKYILIDYKTSNEIYPATALQLAAYATLIEENLGIKISERWVAHIGRNKHSIKKFTDPTDVGVFLGAVMGWKFKERNGLLKVGKDEK